MSHPVRPLDGITVISLEHAIAAPFCTRQLADMGARVIKIERPGVGDFARGYDERVRGMASHFVWTNRSKESLALDLKNDHAMKVLDSLLERADVLVQNLAPGAAARMGLSFDELHKRFPKLIVCDISGYGDGGPYETKKAYDRRHCRGHVCLLWHSQCLALAQSDRLGQQTRCFHAGEHDRVDEFSALLCF